MISILCVVSTLMAVPYEQTEEYRQKQAILNERAAKFKAETGFEGSITYNHQYAKFSNITGNFRDIEITAPQDSVSMRQVFDQVVLRMRPYLSAQVNQLYSGGVSCHDMGSRVIYRQIVNGYKIENGWGLLKLSYSNASKKLNILDNTAVISSETVPINISLEKAIKLAQDEISIGANEMPYNPRIAYTLSGDSTDPRHYLCYILIFWGKSVCVDVSDSTIRKISENKVSKSCNVEVKREVYYDKSTDTTQNNSDE